MARRLLADGVPVRALVRQPASDAAKSLAAAGAELVTADLTDRASLEPALSGARAVFSVQTPDINDLASDVERVNGLNLVEAARRAGVSQFVPSAVARLGSFLRQAALGKAAEWGNSRYWESKAVVGQALPDAGFASWTEFRPAFFMSNLTRPSIWFENQTGETIVTAVDPDKPLAVVAVQDIGTAAAAAFADPLRFHGHAIELASDVLSLNEMAAALTAAGAPARVEAVTPEQGKARGMLPELIDNQVGMNNAEITATPRSRPVSASR